MADAEGQDDVLGGPTQGNVELSAFVKTGMGNGDSSPRCAVVLDAPLANPIFMSDAPSFLQRQRNRAAKALVSEHAGTITCRCQKCAEAARARAGPAVSPDWPLPPVTKSVSSTLDVFATAPAPQARLPSSPHGRRSPQQMKRGVPYEMGNMAADQRPYSPEGGVPTVKRDYTWLLRVIAEAVPSEGGGVAGSVSYDGTWVPDPGSLQGKLGILIPDTVILEKGKPKRRYHIDPAGRIQVTRMKTSAELLRVLRDFVRKAIKPREPASRQDSKDSKVLAGSKSEGSLQAATSSATTSFGVASVLDSRAASGGPLAIPQIEVAVLCYDDGLSRLMMLAEAVSQIRGASKLPREFWQHIHVLQVPIQSRRAGVPTRYITYSFDINSGGLEPQEPMPLGGGARIRLRSASRSASGRNWNVAQKAESEAARLAAVPKCLNEHLRSRSRRVGMEIVQGQFEFVLDEADGTLWLANASNLRCRFLPKSSHEDKSGKNVTEDVVRFFEEEEFEEELRDTEKRMDQLKQRFGGDPGVAHGGIGASGIMVSPSDQLSGIRVPNNLVRFYEEEEKMLRYYEDEVRVMALRRSKPLSEGSRAVGLGCWFRRWVRGVKGPRPGRRAILE